jgi:hypothetical protein
MDFKGVRLMECSCCDYVFEEDEEYYTCPICGEIMCYDCTRTCTECGKVVCVNCYGICEYCEEGFCYDCLALSGLCFECEAVREEEDYLDTGWDDLIDYEIDDGDLTKYETEIFPDEEEDDE